ncbi:hypothetical protein B5X24_HaOG213345 [Helicoverpa armigera]|uniref:Uncharacterized protein n=1 Tax=Helicoverpa armigera TaxID=29058 RepID=A0A2W1B5F6_HELAM|nr:hypothetical protein B5X24_HaOG213345 [Helicoverpa armigera]
MIRAAAYILRFIRNARYKHERKQGSLTIDELRNSTILLARLSQIDSFPQEYNLLSNKSSVRVITMFHYCEIFGQAYMQGTMSTAVNSFRKCGIWPYNQEVD